MKIVERRKLMRYAKIGVCKFDGVTARSRAQQQFAKDADINVIMSRYQKSGVLVDPVKIGNRRAIFGDFSDVQDFHTARNQVLQAEAEFMSLPARVRAKFDNDPAQLLAFVADDANYDEALKLGLVEKRADVVQETETNIDNSGNTAPTL